MHSILVWRLIESAHILVKHEDGVIVEHHLSLAQTLRVARSGPSASSILGLDFLVKKMINRCSTCNEVKESEGTFTVILMDPSRDSPLHKAPQLLQLSMDIKGPWKVRFEGAGVGIYPSYLKMCSCHRLLSHISQAHVEEALKTLTSMQITIYRCDCPGVIKPTGSGFSLALIWQLPSNPRQLLKKRQVLVQPLYFGSEACSPSSVHFYHEHHVVPRDLSRGQMVKEHFPKPRPADQCSNHYRPTSQADQTALDVIVYQDYNLHWCFHGFLREIKNY